MSVEDVIDNLLIGITVDDEKIQILGDAFLVNVGQFFMLLGQNVLPKVTGERKQFGLDGDVLVFPDYKLGLTSIAPILTGNSAFKKLFLRL